MEKGIFFLGTAGDASVFGRQIRASGGILIKTEENQVHLNPGPGSLVMYKQTQQNPRETTAIVLSGQSVLQAGDTNALIEAMTLDGLDKKGVLVSFQSEDLLVTDYHRGLVERHITLDKDTRIALNDIEMLPTPSTHEQQCGFVLYTADYVLGYVGKTGYQESVAKAFKDVNVLIVPCKHPEGIDEPHTLNLEEVKQFVTLAKPNLVVLTGFGSKMLARDIIDEARSVQKETRIQTIAATDGLHINPQSYAKGFRQQKLSGF